MSDLLITDECECCDTGCPTHRYDDECGRQATKVLYRIDQIDTFGTRLCRGCAADCLASGLFTDESPTTTVTGD